ncbi:restriction endonuclease subunit S [Vibrio splendidus]|uniref:restriction endonuclease subunit S n=1 Tax=Vibrio splendidus TaxID=29497 RepID=UPI000D3C2C2D|nr:restriction endonuclease subunit S [Vibrio splendidus]PTO89793.1 restriction endonuclease subunit S [Vibrio splendidus]PTP49490.1 restriction endonuclease subunit S [Vibrio splendidus]
MVNDEFEHFLDGANVVKLKDVSLKIGSGSTPRGGESAYIDEREVFAFVRSQNVYDFRFNTDGIRFITDGDAHKLKGVHLQRDDILLNITGDGLTFARCCLVPESILPAAVNQHVCIIRVDKEKCLPSYLLAFLCLPETKKYIENFNAGGSRRAITKGHIESFEIPLLPMTIQKVISRNAEDILCKQKLNNQINQTLEQMAQTLFKSWFVDFDPVKAKMNGEQPKGMNAATASLFPEKLVESELGLIPEGWEVKPLDKVAHFQNGLALQKFRPESEDDEFLPVLKIAQLRQGYCDGKEKARTDIKESCRVYDGDMIFSWSGSLMIDLWTGGNAALNQHLFKVTSEEYNLPLYLFWTKHHLVKFQQIAKDKAVTMGHIKRGHLSESLCVIPPKELRDKMDEVLMPLINQGLNLRLQSNQLAALRDTLLPKLLSGEIDLENVQVEQAKALAE